jgi:hypothetical protein
MYKKIALVLGIIILTIQTFIAIVKNMPDFTVSGSYKNMSVMGQIVLHIENPVVHIDTSWAKNFVKPVTLWHVWGYKQSQMKNGIWNQPIVPDLLPIRYTYGQQIEILFYITDEMVEDKPTIMMRIKK